MREMKDSGIEWIGDIPKDWQIDRLQWHLKEVNVLNNPIQTEDVLSLTIGAGVIPYVEKGNQGNKAKEDCSQYKIAFPNTLVVNSMNVIIGAVGISKYLGCVSPVYYVFEPLAGTDLRFVYYLFTNVGFQKEMRKYAKGILEIRLRISSCDLLKRIIPVPIFDEQQRIANYLDGHTRSCGCINAERQARLDITGQRWGRLVAVRHVGYTTIEQTGKKQAVWLWQCDCGNTKEIPATQVKHGGTRSCGCKAMEHITDLRKQDITGERFGRLTAVRPTEQRDNNGSVIWELRCDCGNLTYKTVNALKSGRVLSCGCKYRETRSETVKHRRDMVEGTNVSNIVVSKHLRSNNTSGHTGVGLDRRTGKWYAYINFQKKHYNLGLHKDKSAAIRARRAAEARLHDPVILEYWDSLTEKRKKEFQDYLRSTNK